MVVKFQIAYARSISNVQIKIILSQSETPGVYLFNATVLVEFKEKLSKYTL